MDRNPEDGRSNDREAGGKAVVWRRHELPHGPQGGGRGCGSSETGMIHRDPASGPATPPWEPERGVGGDAGSPL